MKQPPALSLGEIMKIGFKVSKEADMINDKMKRRMGSTPRYLPARLAIAYAIHKDVKLPKKPTSGARVIKGSLLFGTDVEVFCWFALIQAAFPTENLSTARSYEAAVSALWESGLNHLDDLWNSVGQNRGEFIKQLAEVAGINTSGSMSAILSSTDAGTDDSVGKVDGVQYSTGKVSLSIGKVSQDTKSGSKVFWELNRDGNSPVIAFTGSMGKGKTETAFQMIEQIHEQSDATFLVFDVKGDLSKPKRSRQTGATIIDCLENSVPLDVFTPVRATDKDIKLAAQEFRDTFVQIPKGGMGANQHAHCFKAAYNAMKSMKSSVTLASIRAELDKYYEEEDIKRDSLQNTMDGLCVFDHFVPKLSLDSFFAKSWILDIHKLSPSAQNLITFFVIDALWNWYSKQSDSSKSGCYRALRNVLVVDEARELLKRGQRSLINIVRQSRSKGGATVFMSQSPDDFDVKNDDFLTNIGLVVAFATNAKPTSLKRVLGASVDLGGLENGHCYTRLITESKKPLKVKVW